MRSGLKSFVKVMDLASDAVSSVGFQDTGGTVVPCNYFSVQCRNVSALALTFGTNEHGYFFATPSSADATPIYGTAVLASATSESGPGAGGVAGTADATVEMSFLPPDRAAGVTIYNSLGTKGRFVITYGNIQSVNPARDGLDGLYPRGS